MRVMRVDCDNITIVHEGIRNNNKRYIYTTTTQRVKIQLIHYKDTKDSGKQVVSDYGQDTNWTKSPEDNQGVHIPAQAEPEGFPS